VIFKLDLKHKKIISGVGY